MPPDRRGAAWLVVVLSPLFGEIGSEFDRQPLGTERQFGYFGDALERACRFQFCRSMEGVHMGGIVTAHYIIGANSGLSRQQLDKIIEILDIRDAEGELIKPPVGENCNYVLVLEKADQDVPATGDNTS